MLDKTTIDCEILDVYFKHKNDKFPFLNQDLYFPSAKYFSNTVQQVTGNVPDWKNLLSQHISVTTALQGTRYEVDSIHGYIRLVATHGANLPPEHPDHNVDTYDWYGGLLDLGLPAAGSNTSLATAEDHASEQFLKAARNALTSFQGGTFVGELAEAIHGIRHPAESLVDFLKRHVKDAKRIRNKLVSRGTSIRKVNQVISDLWLERSYQWLPLCGDLESAGTALAQLSALEDAKVASGEGFDDYALDNSFRSTAANGPFEITYVVRHHEESRCRFYGQVVAFHEEDPGPFGDFLRTKLGLTLSDAAPTAWELIPFSFVADYFSNLGSMISAYSFPTAAIRWMNRGLLTRHSVLATDMKLTKSTSSAGEQYEYTSDNPGSYKATYVTFLRTAFSPGDLIPSFRLDVPGISSWPKWLNLAALANSIRG